MNTSSTYAIAFAYIPHLPGRKTLIARQRSFSYASSGFRLFASEPAGLGKKG